MKFKSPHGPVDIPALGLVDVTVVEATGDDAKSLQAQGWTRVGTPKPRKKAAKKTAAKTPPPSGDEDAKES